MNKNIKKQWVDALRSGKYKQGFGCLRNKEDNSFCAIGILADIVDPNGWSSDADGLGRYTHDNRIASISYDLANVVGIYDDYVENVPFDLCYGAIHARALDVVMDMNDILNMNFEQIADWIEENL